MVQLRFRTPREFQTPVGAIHGIQVTLTGEAPGRPPAYLTPSGLRVPMNDPHPLLLEWAGVVDLEFLSDRVAEISAVRFAQEDRFARELRAGGWEPSVSLRDYQMALVLRTLLTARRPSSGSVKPTVGLMAELCAMAAALRCSGDRRMELGGSSPHALLQRIAYQQFWDQEDYSGWTRGLMLQRRISQELQSSKTGLDLNHAFQELYGLDLETFCFLTFGLFSAATAQPGKTFDVEQLAGSRHFTVSSPEVDAFYKLVASNFHDYAFRAMDTKVYVDGYEPYSINPLTNWPVLKRPSGHHNVPVPRLLLQRATISIYYDFMHNLDQRRRDAFGNAWGNAFGEYCGDVIARTPTAGRLHRADKLIASGPVCDWIVDDTQVMVFIESKTRGLSAPSKITGDEQSIKRDIVRRGEGSSLARALVQIAESDAALRTRFTDRRRLGLIVTLDTIHLANDRRYLQRFIREAAESELGRSIDLEFQVVDAQSFERLCALSIATNRSLGRLLAKKMEEATFELDLLRTDGFSKRRTKAHPIFEQVGEPLFNSLLRKYLRPGANLDDE